ncbi:MAG: hypothetical protein AB1324_06390 [Candidatus Micrarchaeota archaeon]
MSDYKDQKTGVMVAMSGEKFPTTGTRIVLKSRPPVAKEVTTD